MIPSFMTKSLSAVFTPFFSGADRASILPDVSRFVQFDFGQMPLLSGARRGLLDNEHGRDVIARWSQKFFEKSDDLLVSANSLSFSPLTVSATVLAGGASLLWFLARARARGFVSRLDGILTAAEAYERRIHESDVKIMILKSWGIPDNDRRIKWHQSMIHSDLLGIGRLHMDLQALDQEFEYSWSSLLLRSGLLGYAALKGQMRTAFEQVNAILEVTEKVYRKYQIIKT